MNDMHRRESAVIALAIVAWSVSCNGNPLGPAENDLARASALWSAAGPASYDFDLQVNCSCAATAFGTVTVSVRNHQVVNVVRADNGTTVDSLDFQGVLTIDRMFATERGFLDAKPVSFRADYDAHLGYPTLVSVDPNANVANDAYGFQVVGLRAVLTP